MPLVDATYLVPAELGGRALDGVLRALAGATWGEVRRAIETGKVSIEGERAGEPTRKVRAGARLEVAMRARRAEREGDLPASAIVHVDSQLVVVHKPAFVSTVPFEPGERGTLDEMVARALHRGRRGPPPSLGVVQRLDKETTGLVVFARTFAAKKALASQLRFHTMHRRYLAIAHGVVAKRTLRSRFVDDRGDGLRGSTHLAGRGQESVTHVEPLEALEGATLVACRLETGRTHQIRIHLSECGHPLVGERVYVRGFSGEKLSAPRVMLHAAELGFVHPATGEEVRFEAAMPPDMRAVVRRLGGG